MIQFLLLIVFSCLFVIFLLRNYYKNRKFWEKFNKFKGDKPWPIIGHATQFLTDDLNFIANLERMHREHGSSTFRLQILSACFVILTEPDTCEVILRSTKEIHKSGDYSFLFDWLGEGLFLSNGNKDKHIRKAITPMLHFKTLENFVGVFEDKGDILIKKLSAYKGKVFNVHHLMTLCSLDVISEAVMGVVIKAQEDPESEYIRAIYSECELFKARLFSSWKRIDSLYHLTSDYRQHKKNIKVLHSLTDRIIKSGAEKFQAKQDNNANNKLNGMKKDNLMGYTFLDMLLSLKQEDGTPLSNQTMRAEVNSLLFGGHETVSVGLSCTVYALANNPHIQNIALAEQRELLGDNLAVVPSYEDLEKMKYLERVIKESLRLYPPAPVYSRLLQDDLKLADGSVIPAGCQVAIVPYLLARNPKFYPDPYKFDPDRFLPENTQNKHPYSLLSFSAGPRNCVGQRFAMFEMKSILSKILRTYELLPGGPGTELQLTMEVLLKSKNGIQISLKDRVYS